MGTHADRIEGFQPEFDVAIIGLGPIGITLAGLLGDLGHRVLAIDAAAEIYDLPRAIGMDQEVMRVFQQLGITDELKPFLSDYKDSEYRTADGDTIRKFQSQKPPYPLSWPPYQTFLQPNLERVLHAKVSKQSNVTLFRNRDLQEVEDLGQFCTMKILDSTTSEISTATSRFLVGCDGGNSFVRQNLGIAFEDLVFDEPWLVVDMLVNENVELPEVNIQFCDPERPHTYVVGPNNLRRWEFMIMPGEVPADIAKDESVWALLAPWLNKSQARLWRAATYRFHALVAEQWRKGNIFLAGDACHMTPPFLAQGMVQGIKDTANLSWKIDAVLKGASEGLLDTYVSERRPLVREVIAITKELGRIICETNPIKAVERNLRMGKDMVEGRGVSVRQNMFPPIASGPLCLTAKSGSTAPGQPAPQPRIETDKGLELLDDITGHGFSVLALPEYAITSDKIAQIERLGVGFFAIGKGQNGNLKEANSVFLDWMHLHNARAILVRPDHMVLAALDSFDDLAIAIGQIKHFLPK